MESNEVLIDFSLPNNPDTLKFLKLKQSDKIKAIDTHYPNEDDIPF